MEEIQPLNNFDINTQAELLAERFEKGIKDGFGATLILHSIGNRQGASSKEIKEDIDKTFGNKMAYNYTSFYRLITRLRDEFKLISEKEKIKSKGPNRISYELTPIGKLLLEIIIDRYIRPLEKLLK